MKWLSYVTLFGSFFTIFSSNSAESNSNSPSDSDSMSPEERERVNREMIEAILNLVSPACRSEMEAAIESQTDVTQECKIEIQQAVQLISGYGRDDEERDGERDGERDEESEGTKQSDSVTPSRSGIHPGYWIAAFVVALIGGVSAYVIHVNKLLEEAFPAKQPKKLSKKKLEKARMKGNQ